MKISGLFLLTCSTIGNAWAEEGRSCHLYQEEDERIYRICEGEAKEEIPFDYETFAFMLLDDDQTRELAVLTRIPLASQLRDQWYFIFDYAQMAVYDDECLGGNFAMLDSEKERIVFQKYGERGYRAFERADYAHCKKDLSAWSGQVGE